MKPFSIAIDGPAGSGKSVVSKAISSRLGILHLDTGAMYRAVAYKAISLGISPSDSSRVIPMLDKIKISVDYDGSGAQQVFVDGVNVMPYIRTPEVSKGASDIAVIPEVRIKLVQLQREIAAKTSLVLDGRDIGSYVLPNADFKIYLTADSRERARRRLKEMQAVGIDLDKSLDKMTEEIEARDLTDSTRKFAPLTRLPEAIYIDTTKLTIEEVVDTLLNAINLGNNG